MKKSFIVVNSESHFPIENLPYGVFSTEDNVLPRVGVAIGDYVLDLSVLEEEGFFAHLIQGNQPVFNRPYLNDFMRQGKQVWSSVRKEIQRLLSAEEPELRDHISLRNRSLYLQNEIQLHLPVKVGDYTDFYASKEHATNVGVMFRGKENALMPNWTHLPVGYHGRASSLVLSGTNVRRPNGQIKPPNMDKPIFGPCKQLDFELEMGWLIGTGNEQGVPVSVDQAEEHIFGAVLLNDWSARDIQAWEYQPLGPFLAKNFASSISPWVVTLEALEPFRVNGPVQNPQPLEYLHQQEAGAFNIQLEVYLKGEKQYFPKLISSSNYRSLYWSAAQMVAHHTVGGCNLNTGDLLGTGTISGEDKNSRGSLLELTWRGTEPIQLDNDEQREWLEDGDELTMTGWCQGDGYRVGFGEVLGKVEPAIERTALTIQQTVTK